MSFSGSMLLRRCMSTAARAVKVAKPGQVTVETGSVPTAGSSQVVVKMMAAPISEYDVAVINGQVGPFNGTAGTEGVGTVTSVGSGVSDININDWVVPTSAGTGTLAEYVVADASQLQVVPNDISVTDAAFIGGTNCTALRLISDFGASGSIVQNAANTPVGQAVVQIAAAKGIPTINIIPDGPSDDAVVEHLYSLGANIVVTEGYANSVAFQELIGDLPRPNLGINGAGGAAATIVARTVGDGASLVTYGGKAPINIPTSVLVRKAVSLLGFSLERWNSTASPAERASMVRAVSELVQEKKLRSTVDASNFSDVVGALNSFQSQSNQATAAPVVTM